MTIKYGFLFLMLIFLGACSNNNVTKPRAMLRLDYPQAQYETYKKTGSYEFRKNTRAVIGGEKENALNLEYPL